VETHRSLYKENILSDIFLILSFNEMILLFNK